MLTSNTQPPVSTIKSNTDKIRNLNIPDHTSNMDLNVTSCVIPSIDTSILHPPPTSPLITFNIQTTIVPYNSPTIDGILRQPIEILVSS